jgi:hypothetical protein
MNKWISAATVAAFVTMVGSVASAQQKDQPQESGHTGKDLGAATHSLELTIGTGYAQGLGNVGDGQLALTDVAQAGGSIQAGVGYRVIPQLTLGVYGSGSMYGRGGQVDGSTNIYSATTGVEATYHILPAASELDPWVSLGTGWRGYWEHADQGTTSMHGWQIAKLQVGLDYRIDKAIAIAPVVGADMTTFFTQATPASSGWESISSPKVNAFLFAGVQGRFDIPVGPDSAQVASR